MGLPDWRPANVQNVFLAALKENNLQRARAAQNALWNHPDGISLSRLRDVPLTRWAGLTSRRRRKQRYLFVSGVPRSGTTALGRLLGRHKDVAMFIELYPAINGYTPEMLRPTNITALCEQGIMSLTDVNANVLRKSATAKFLGDKRPGFMRSAELTLEHFQNEQIIVIHIVRNIHDLICSYERRVQNGTWSKNFRSAVTDANMNNQNALRVLNGRHRDRIVVLDYENFWRAKSNAYKLLSRSGLDTSRMDDRAVNIFFGNASKIQKRERTLDSSIVRYTEAHYDIRAEEALRQIAQTSLDNIIQT